MSTGTDEREQVADLLEELEQELAAIKRSADGERLDTPRPQARRRPSVAPTAPARVIDSRGLDLNRLGKPPRSLPARPVEDGALPALPARRDDGEKVVVSVEPGVRAERIAPPVRRRSLAERLAHVTTDVAE